MHTEAWDREVWMDIPEVVDSISFIPGPPAFAEVTHLFLIREAVVLENAARGPVPDKLPDVPLRSNPLLLSCLPCQHLELNPCINFQETLWSDKEEKMLYNNEL